MDTNSSSILSSEEEENDVKISVRVDSCLLCALPAVTYDLDGNIIKRESSQFSSREVQKWSNEELFSYLCQGFDFEKKSRKWELKLNPLPFCESCELLINSLAEVYSKLEELKTVLRAKIEGAEEVYSAQKLYERHDNVYLEFRKDVLGDKFIGLSNQHRNNSLSTRENAKCSSQRKMTKVNPKKKVEDHSSVQVTRTLRKRSIQKQYDERSCSSNEEEDEPESALSERDHDDDDYLSDDSRVCNEEDNPPHQKSSPKAVKKEPERKRKNPERVPVAVNKKRKRWLQKSTFRAPCYGYLERDERTGSITYSTGFGNRFKSNRTTLIFNQIKKEGGKLEYECSSCSSCFPVLTCTRFQQRLFRQHFLSRHSNHYNCGLCPEPVKHSSKEELVQHIKTVHSIDSYLTYSRRCSYIKFKSNQPKSSRSKKKITPALEGQLGPGVCEQMPWKCCQVCGKPFEDLRSKAFQTHVWTHMSEEDKQQRAKYTGRTAKELLIAPSDEQLSSGLVSQCQTCGKYITKGEAGLRQHIQEFHELSSSSAPKNEFVCNLCGVSYASKYSLASHMEKRHPNGEWDGPFKCGYPGCSQSLDTELNLKAHVKDSHEQNAEQDNQVLCLTCGKVLSSKQSLQQHELLHLGKKSHECQICGKKCTVKDTLRLHMANKHGIGTKTWKCEEEGCGKVFPNRKYFQVHRRLQHGVYLKKRKSNPI